MGKRRKGRGEEDGGEVIGEEGCGWAEEGVTNKNSFLALIW